MNRLIPPDYIWPENTYVLARDWRQFKDYQAENPHLHCYYLQDSRNLLGLHGVKIVRLDGWYLNDTYMKGDFMERLQLAEQPMAKTTNSISIQPLSAQIRSAIQSLIAAGISQTDIAARAQVRQPALSQWLAGKKQFNEVNLDRLAEAAGVRLATIQGVVVTKPQQ